MRSILFICTFIGLSHSFADAKVSPIATELADRDSMTPFAREIFFLNDPKIVNNQKYLNETCADREHHSKQMNLLGCYLSVDRGIFIYSITDPRLRGTMETTAAHEMLHAAYLRLEPNEKTRIDELLERAYKNVNDSDINYRIGLYLKDQRDAELHSVLGTEIANLPPELEKYYSRYFIERTKVVSLCSQSKAQIKLQISKVASYDRKLDELKKEIESQTNSISRSIQDISELRRRLTLIPRDQVTEYNRQVNNVNQKIKNYNRAVLIYDRSVNQFNLTAKERNQLANDTLALVEILDTRARPNL